MTTAEILASVVAKTGRDDITTVNSEIYAVLVDMTTRFPFLKKRDSLAILLSTWEYALPTGFREMDVMYDSQGNGVEKVGDISEFMSLRGDGTDIGEPDAFHVYGRHKIMVNPVPDAAYTFPIFYSYLHPNNFSTGGSEVIELADDFIKCVTQGVCWEVMLGKGLDNEGMIYAQGYEKELVKQAVNFPSEVGCVKYRG